MLFLKNIKCFYVYLRKIKFMDWTSIILIICVALVFIAMLYYLGRDKKYQSTKVDNNRNNDNDIKIVSRKLTVPLRIQACERLLLYIERIQFPVLIKRVFNPAMSRADFQFSLLQNVQDEFEHNLAQRLYVSEETWHLVNLSREEVLQNINAVFNDNPDADVAMIAQKLASFDNPMVEKAVINIKREFNYL